MNEWFETNNKISNQIQNDRKIKKYIGSMITDGKYLYIRFKYGLYKIRTCFHFWCILNVK